MRWLQNIPAANVHANDRYRLMVIEQNAPPRTIVIPDLDWIAFVNTLEVRSSVWH